MECVLQGQRPVLAPSPRQRATETVTLALPEHRTTVEPLVAEFDYGDYEGLTTEQIGQRAPGWGHLA
ncbi:histidine phosphatase family protein [Micromonosporaceae bacterium Da 78-11]